MKRGMFVLWAAWLCFSTIVAQRSVVYDDNIRTLTLSTSMGQSVMPVLRMGTDDRLTVSFDDLMHNYRRFSYTLHHVGHDFITEEDLFESEYVATDNSEVVLDDYTQSLNTTVLYNHYSFSLPNASMRPLLSGNYRLSMSVEDEEGEMQKAFDVYFAVAEQVLGVSMSASGNTEVDVNEAHQQLTVEVNHAAINMRDPVSELRTVVVQNGQWDRSVVLQRPTMQTGSSLKWMYTRQLTFAAGNEYRRFEQMSTRYPGMHVEHVRFFEPYYYTTLMTDAPRRNYLYDEDHQGCFVPRTDTGGDANTEADYTWTCFSVASEPIPDAEVYVNGVWSGGNFTQPYRMTYNPATQCYEALVLLKQGYYDYRYLVVRDGVGTTAELEGDFYETENDYEVFVYYRAPGGRYDRLVAWRKASYRNAGGR